ncbi:hypothetical protein IWW48_005123 [Coemansia sp. RSA 1200]|nr:hypothetical protein IWW48_005123 [Coemansia sp. RSA 1200]
MTDNVSADLTAYHETLFRREAAREIARSVLFYEINLTRVFLINLHMGRRQGCLRPLYQAPLIHRDSRV